MHGVVWAEVVMKKWCRWMWWWTWLYGWGWRWTRWSGGLVEVDEVVSVVVVVVEVVVFTWGGRRT